MAKNQPYKKTSSLKGQKLFCFLYMQNAEHIVTSEVVNPACHSLISCFALHDMVDYIKLSSLPSPLKL